MTDDTITQPDPTLTQVASVTPTNAGELTNPPKSPLKSPDPKIRQAWQTALWRMRQKNAAGRPPL
jgi:hypothetical protein